MDNELREKISKYREEIKKEIQELEEKKTELVKEGKELTDKFNAGEVLTQKEIKQNSKIKTLIAEIDEEIKVVSEQLNLFKELDAFELLKKSLVTLSEKKTTKKDKEIIKKCFIEEIKKLNKTNEEKIIESGVLTEEELQDISKTKRKLTNEKKKISTTINTNKDNNIDSINLEERLEEIKNALEAIKDYEKYNVNITELETDLNKLANNSTSKTEKDKIINKYSKLIDKFTELSAKNLECILNNPDVKLSEKEQKQVQIVKEIKKECEKQLSEKDNKLSESAKNIAKIGGIVALCAVIIITIKSCTKNIDKNINDEKPGIEQEATQNQNRILNLLLNKGYNKDYALVIANKYDNIKEFNIDYLEEYETAWELYQIEAAKAVDYVNRSAKIQETNFYNDATINEIVKVVMSIDNQELFMANNNVLEHSINDTLTEIYNNYAFTNNSNEADAKKLEALTYFAKDGSELDNFLTEYSILVKTVLYAKNDNNLSNTAKQNMFNYLDTFANSFAGNTQDIEINENTKNAVVTDTYDWNIAYSAFIKPLMSMYINENNITDYICLQTNLLSNYEQWAQVNCDYGQSRTLGGE